MSYNILKRKHCPNETVTKLMNAVLIEGEVRVKGE